MPAAASFQGCLGGEEESSAPWFRAFAALEEDLPASPARQAAAVAAAAAGRLHCLTTARARLSLADLQIQATSLWKIRELPPQDQEKKNSMLLYRVPRSKTGCS